VQRVRLVAGLERHIGAKAQDVMLVDPHVIRVFLRTWVALEARPRQGPGTAPQDSRRGAGGAEAAMGADAPLAIPNDFSSVDAVAARGRRRAIALRI
jgi:hypothetical protein